MNKFQKLNFKSVEEFLEYLPPKERILVDRLRELVLDVIPNPKEKISYNVPFYYAPKWFCLIWPAAVPWGNLKEGVSISFINGRKIEDVFGFLEFDNRKHTGRIVFKSLKEIKEKEEALRFYISEAFEINNPVH
jgi:hypothetical protein